MSRRKQKFPIHLKSCGGSESPVSSSGEGGCSNSSSSCSSSSSSSSSSDAMVLSMGPSTSNTSSHPPRGPQKQQQLMTGGDAPVGTWAPDNNTRAKPHKRTRYNNNTETVNKSKLQSSVNGNTSESSHRTMSNVISVSKITSMDNVSSSKNTTTSAVLLQNGSLRVPINGQFGAQRVPINGQMVQASPSKPSDNISHSLLSPLTVPYVIVSSSHANGKDNIQLNNKLMSSQITDEMIQNKLNIGANFSNSRISDKIKEEFINITNGGLSNLIPSSSAIVSRTPNIQNNVSDKKSDKYDQEMPSVECIVNIEEGNKFVNKSKKKEFISSSDTEEVNKSSIKTEKSEYVNTCPVCHIPFKSKRSFNKHILIHCQLVNGSNEVVKRQFESAFSPSPEKKRIRAFSLNEQLELLRAEENMSVPLDLSCRTSSQPITPGLQEQFTTTQLCGRPVAASTPEPQDQKVAPNNLSALSERGPLEDENENLVNEGREREAAFFNMGVNEAYLREDSTSLEPPPALPLYQSHSNNTRKVRVCSDDGPPMVYTVNVHAEQVVVTRILGVNAETGDKMELYKCFLCGIAFPSVSRLQGHLTQHKQRFVCSKCSFSCDSRVTFSYHVQREHSSPAITEQRDAPTLRGSELHDETNAAENRVTVADLLSALRAKEDLPNQYMVKDAYNDVYEDEDPGSEDSYPRSPSSESQEAGEVLEGNTGEDMLKMYSCRFCGKKFDRAFSCNRHERVHTGYKPCFCRVCGRGFSEPRNLRHHVIRFHSDGSLRHLIKRDRRKGGYTDINGDYSDEPTPSVSPVPPTSYPENHLKDILKETANKLITTSNIDISGISGQNNGLEIQLANRSNTEGSIRSVTSNMSNPANLTKIITASLDNTAQSTAKKPPAFKDYVNEDLEPGEIRLDAGTRIVEDAESGGRRLVISDDPAEEGMDHSPQFSSYAPRLNIVAEPIDRDKALLPITDDIGRTFYECPYCHKLFGSSSDMNRHLDFHEDLRPYNCEYCDYSARTNSQLKVHKMRHEGIKLFTCDVCNYNGVTQSDLNRHKKTQSHVARSQNICTMCGLGFYTTSQRQVHIVQCHPEVEGASSLIQMSLGGPPMAPMAPLTALKSSASSVQVQRGLSVNNTAPTQLSALSSATSVLSSVASGHLSALTSNASKKLSVLTSAASNQLSALTSSGQVSIVTSSNSSKSNHKPGNFSSSVSLAVISPKIKIDAAKA